VASSVNATPARERSALPLLARLFRIVDLDPSTDASA
jgi:hypothetical protein